MSLNSDDKKYFELLMRGLKEETMSLNSDDKEYFELLMRGLKAELISSTDILNNKVDGVNARLDKINGRINKHDEQITESIKERKVNEQRTVDEIKRLDDKIVSSHIMNCPNMNDIKELKENALTNKNLKKFVLIGLSSTVAIVTIILSLLKIFGIAV